MAVGLVVSQSTAHASGERRVEREGLEDHLTRKLMLPRSKDRVVVCGTVELQ